MRIEQDAANLSGGQRQRIAVARALLHDAPIMIFDEATSSVDAESERLIMRTVHELAERKTQRQRIAVARALLHDAPIMIFDEATSSVDAESERLIMRTVHELAERKTVILVTHRLAHCCMMRRS